MSKVCNENNPKAKDPKYICNHATGNWVLKSGSIGKKLLNGGGEKKSIKSVQKKVCNNNLPKAKDPKYICNPATGVWVLKSGKIGQTLVQTKPKSPLKPQAIQTKPKSLLKPQAIQTKPKSPIKTQHKPPVSLYKNQLYKSKNKYGLKIPILDKLNITYETWNNKDNTAGTCFWHAVSKGLGLTFPEMANKIKNMAESLPGNLKYKYKTKEYVANKLINYKKSGFGMGPKGYCIVPKIAQDTALIIFAVKEVKPKQFDTIGVFCVAPENVYLPKLYF